MNISVASGKGGTGKTTIATSLAVSLPGETQLLDCDVEEPNAHLFINPEIQQKEMVNSPIPSVNFDKCNFCRKCMDICRFGAIAVIKNSVMVFENHCHSCGGCREICPEEAIRLSYRPIGEVEWGEKNSLDFIHGRMGVGQVMAPPIIKQVKSLADNECITIIDAPPGTSCPAIAAMNKTDFVILVTEPTPFGLNDLKLAVETIRKLDIPHGIVINRAGLGNDAVKNYADHEKIPVLMELPFSKKIARIYSNGGIIAQELPELKTQFIDLYDSIKLLVENRRMQ